jgi:hypothetical protein
MYMMLIFQSIMTPLDTLDDPLDTLDDPLDDDDLG